MQTYDGIAAAADAARLFYLINGSTLPEEVQAKVQPYVGTGSSPVDLVVHFAEAIYANRSKAGVKAEAKQIAAGCAVLAEGFGFHGLNVDSRGSRMAQVLDGNSEVEAPEPKAEYTTVPTPPPAPPAA